jgi:hypothetical protein
MKTKERSNAVVKLWHRLIGWRARQHDPFLSLSIAHFNFAGAWDRLVQKRQ